MGNYEHLSWLSWHRNMIFVFLGLHALLRSVLVILISSNHKYMETLRSKYEWGFGETNQTLPHLNFSIKILTSHPIYERFTAIIKGKVNMRVHYLQHAKCDGPGSMSHALRSRGHTLTSTQLYLDETLPAIRDFDWLIILGGDMGVYDEASFPWLMREKTFIRNTIEANKLILGICLGSQLIAHVLGARIRKNRHKEIGWFPITPLDVIKKTILADVITGKPDVFHWHEDTADLPDGAIAIAESEACSNQGFVYGKRIVGLQFHPEITKDAAEDFFRDCGQNIEGGPYIQSPSKILSNDWGFAQSSQIMEAILEAMERF